MVALAGADRLDLGAGQRDARLDRVLDGIVEPGLAIFGDDLDRALVLFGHDEKCLGNLIFDRQR